MTPREAFLVHAGDVFHHVLSLIETLVAMRVPVRTRLLVHTLNMTLRRVFVYKLLPTLETRVRTRNLTGVLVVAVGVLVVAAGVLVVVAPVSVLVASIGILVVAAGVLVVAVGVLFDEVLSHLFSIVEALVAMRAPVRTQLLVHTLSVSPQDALVCKRLPTLDTRVHIIVGALDMHREVTLSREPLVALSAPILSCPLRRMHCRNMSLQIGRPQVALVAMWVWAPVHMLPFVYTSCVDGELTFM